MTLRFWALYLFIVSMSLCLLIYLSFLHEINRSKVELVGKAKTGKFWAEICKLSVYWVRSGSDYSPTNVCARFYDNRQLRHQLPPILAFLKKFRVIIKIRADAVCCIYIHVSTVLTNQSVNQYKSFAVTKCQIFRLKCTKYNFGLSSPLDPAVAVWELTALPRSVACRYDDFCPLTFGLRYNVLSWCHLLSLQT